MKRIRSVVIFMAIFCFVLQNNLHSQNYISQSKAKKAIAKLVKDSLLKSASVSFSIMDLRTGKLISSFDKHRALVPASSQKIISCALILNQLSNEYKFSTPFYLKGENQSEGTFNGNIEIIGKGDPSFASDYFTEIPKVQDIADTLSSILKQKGISRIKGNIVVNENFITDIPENKEWLWYDLGNYYGAGCFGFNYAENQAGISLKASKKDSGVCTILSVQPSQLKSNYLCKVIGKMQPDKKDVYVLGNSQSCIQEILGEWKCCTEDTLVIKSALAKPSAIFVQLLKDALKKNGISIEENNIDLMSREELIYSYLSPTLKDMVQRALTKSVNLYCESFVHQYGYIVNGTTNRQQALLKMNQQLSELLSRREAVVIEDGSGLSPKNMISSFAFIEFLEWIYKNKSLQNFWQLLPNAGKQGSLLKYLKLKENSPVSLRLKSGSMERVRSYTGYLVYKEKPVYAMSLLVNHYTCSGEMMNELIAKFLNRLTSQ